MKAQRTPQAASGRAIGRRGMAQPSRSKYGAVRVTVDGFSFASKAEARLYAMLAMLGHARQLRNLEFQPRYPLHVHGVKIGEYRGDFAHDELHDGQWVHVVSDAKGMRTLPLAKWKQKHLLAEYGIRVVEVRR